jgi:hypothetical protein
VSSLKFDSHTKESLYSVPFSVSDEIKSCFEEETRAIKTNKFQRCWKGIHGKYKNTLPLLFQWNVIPANWTQHETPSQNETGHNLPSTNETQHVTSPPNTTEQATTPKSIAKNATQQHSATGQKT